MVWLSLVHHCSVPAFGRKNKKPSIRGAAQHLMPRSERSEHLEAWQQAESVLPPFETPRYARLLRACECFDRLKASRGYTLTSP